MTPEEESGGVASKNVTLNASVESPDGATVEEDDLRDHAAPAGRRVDDYGRDGGGAGSSAFA